MVVTYSVSTVCKGLGNVAYGIRIWAALATSHLLPTKLKVNRKIASQVKCLKKVTRVRFESCHHVQDNNSATLLYLHGRSKCSWLDTALSRRLEA